MLLPGFAVGSASTGRDCIVDIVPTLDLPVDTNVIIPTEDQETPTKTTKTIKITTMTTMI
jgi:hypothetical protein